MANQIGNKCMLLEGKLGEDLNLNLVVVNRWSVYEGAFIIK